MIERNKREQTSRVPSVRDIPKLPWTRCSGTMYRFDLIFNCRNLPKHLLREMNTNPVLLGSHSASSVSDGRLHRYRSVSGPACEAALPFTSVIYLLINHQTFIGHLTRGCSPRRDRAADLLSYQVTPLRNYRYSYILIGEDEVGGQARKDAFAFRIMIQFRLLYVSGENVGLRYWVFVSCPVLINLQARF